MGMGRGGRGRGWDGRERGSTISSHLIVQVIVQENMHSCSGGVGNGLRKYLSSTLASPSSSASCNFRGDTSEKTRVYANRPTPGAVTILGCTYSVLLHYAGVATDAAWERIQLPMMGSKAQLTTTIVMVQPMLYSPTFIAACTAFFFERHSRMSASRSK